MIKLTRLRHSEPFYLNPDFIERIDVYVDTIVRLVSGTEYIVEESADEIISEIIAYRGAILAALPDLHEHLTDAPVAPIVAVAAVTGMSNTTGARLLGEVES